MFAAFDMNFTSPVYKSSLHGKTKFSVCSEFPQHIGVQDKNHVSWHTVEIMARLGCGVYIIT